MVKYIAKPGGWFKPGTEVNLINDYNKETDGEWNAGLFEGIRIPEEHYEFAIGRDINGEIDQEICPWEEFEIVEG